MNALDNALRLAIVRKYPHLGDIDLVNYKVRILDENKGTGAVTRVLLDASDGEDAWGSIGVSENVIEASWQALVDSIEYGMLHGAAAARRRRRRATRRPRADERDAGRDRLPFGRVLVDGAPRACLFDGERCGCSIVRPTNPDARGSA